MTLINQILTDFKPNQIFSLKEIEQKGYPYNSAKTQIKRFISQGKIKQATPGYYYIPQINLLTKTETPFSVFDLLETKYIKSSMDIYGYFSTPKLINEAKISSQRPAKYAIFSNYAPAKPITKEVYNEEITIKKAPCKVDKDNISTLILLELSKGIENYSEISDSLLKQYISEYTKKNKISTERIKKYIKYFPAETYAGLIEGGIINYA